MKKTKQIKSEVDRAYLRDVDLARQQMLPEAWAMEQQAKAQQLAAMQQSLANNQLVLDQVWLGPNSNQAPNTNYYPSSTSGSSSIPQQISPFSPFFPVPQVWGRPRASDVVNPLVQSVEVIKEIQDPDDRLRVFVSAGMKSGEFEALRTLQRLARVCSIDIEDVLKLAFVAISRERT